MKAELIKGKTTPAVLAPWVVGDLIEKKTLGIKVTGVILRVYPHGGADALRTDAGRRGGTINLDNPSDSAYSRVTPSQDDKPEGKEDDTVVVTMTKNEAKVIASHMRRLYSHTSIQLDTLRNHIESALR